MTQKLKKITPIVFTKWRPKILEIVSSYTPL